MYMDSAAVGLCECATMQKRPGIPFNLKLYLQCARGVWNGSEVWWLGTLESASPQEEWDKQMRCSCQPCICCLELINIGWQAGNV